jgi:hypothetical protein
MRKASTWMLEKGTQTPSPSPDHIPAEHSNKTLTGNSHANWYIERGHLTSPVSTTRRERAIGWKLDVTHGYGNFFVDLQRHSFCHAASSNSGAGLPFLNAWYTGFPHEQLFADKG